MIPTSRFLFLNFGRRSCAVLVALIAVFSTTVVSEAGELLLYSAPGGPMEYNYFDGVLTDHGFETELGVTFEVPEGIRIQKIEAWMNGGKGSTANFSVGLLHISDEGLATYFSKTFPVDHVIDAPAKWQGVDSLKWDLPPGEYWFSMSAPDVPIGYGYHGPIPKVASLINVIDYEDYSQPGNIPWAPFGLKVYGTPLSAVPEPSFYGLLGSAGLLALAATRR